MAISFENYMNRQAGSYESQVRYAKKRLKSKAKLSKSYISELFGFDYAITDLLLAARNAYENKLIHKKVLDRYEKLANDFNAILDEVEARR